MAKKTFAEKLKGFFGIHSVKDDEFFDELSVEFNCNVVSLAMYSSEYNGY